MPVLPGTRLGPYEILAPLGAGGMGEVYRARDTRLGREVAIKALPVGFAGAADRLARFEREAQILALLNHPNIAAIHGLEEHNNARYLVLEYVPGETLAERIQRGPLSVEESLEVARQIAAALEAAHEKGVVHRDLKPANIKITPDGRVKVLDFGLAKETPVADSAFQDAANSPTLAVDSPAYTRAGVILGTAAYMSPEQARGKPVDKRADIWAFGCVLYECLTGKMAFGGETVTDTLAAVIKAETDWRALPDAAGPRVRELLRRCLQKDPALRLRDIGDGRILIAEALSGDAEVATPAASRRVRWRWPILAGACFVALVLGLGAGLWWRGRAHPGGSWTAAFLGGPELSTIPRPSPDGHLLAFVAKDSDGVMQVWVMNPESGNRVMLTHRRDLGFVGTCSWSPDGSRIFYDRYYDQLKGVFSVPALGGEEQMILETGGAPEALPDGSLLVSQINPQHQQQLFRYWPDSGKSQALPVIVPNGVLYGWATIRAFSDGRRALVAGMAMGESADAGMRLYVVDLDSGKLRALDADFGDLLAGGGVPAAEVVRDGKSAIFSSTEGPLTRVWSIPIDGHAHARPLFNLTGYLDSLAMGPDGSLYLDQNERPMEIVRFTPQGGRVELVAAVQKPVGDYFAALPDGRAVWAEYAAGHSRLMIAAAGKEPASFLNTTEEISGPLTAAGPGAVAFLIGAEPHRAIGVASLTNGRIVSRIPFDKGRIEQMAASPDGKTLYCAAAGSIWEVTAGGEVRRQHAGNFVTVEPGGQSLLVEVREPPNTRLVRIPLGGGPDQEIRVPGPLQFAYAIDNDGVRNGRLLAPESSPYWYWPPAIFDLTTGKSRTIPLEYVSDFHHMSWTPDGKVIACALAWRSTMWKFTRESR
ncbi:MAG TPA: protein kinase [Candidatus Acidoferrales bacterium]|nr:protein kinase [Candidatus Acidoferrales bacterium]